MLYAIDRPIFSSDLLYNSHFFSFAFRSSDSVSCLYVDFWVSMTFNWLLLDCLDWYYVLWIQYVWKCPSNCLFGVILFEVLIDLLSLIRIIIFQFLYFFELFLRVAFNQFDHIYWTVKKIELLRFRVFAYLFFHLLFSIFVRSNCCYFIVLLNMVFLVALYFSNLIQILINYRVLIILLSLYDLLDCGYTCWSVQSIYSLILIIIILVIYVSFKLFLVRWQLHWFW